MTSFEYERDYEQVRAAIERHADRHASEAPDDSELRRFGASALAFAICAVILLAQERGDSVEVTIQDLVEGMDGPLGNDYLAAKR